MRMTLLHTGKKSKKPMPSGKHKDKQKERMEADHATDEKRDDDEGVCDTKHNLEYEEEQIIMGNCCDGSEANSFGLVFKFLQFHEM